MKLICLEKFSDVFGAGVFSDKIWASMTWMTKLDLGKRAAFKSSLANLMEGTQNT